MLLMQDIGNDIHLSIQLEVDFSSNLEDDKMPILDPYAQRNKKPKLGSCMNSTPKKSHLRILSIPSQLYRKVQSKQC